jgi:hypothetical protein
VTQREFGSWFDHEVGWENFKADAQGCGCWVVLMTPALLVGFTIGTLATRLGWLPW